MQVQSLIGLPVIFICPVHAAYQNFAKKNNFSSLTFQMQIFYYIPCLRGFRTPEQTSIPPFQHELHELKLRSF